MIFASSRCGDFPELVEIRSVIASRFGKDFTAKAIELRNNCAVSPMVCYDLCCSNHFTSTSGAWVCMLNFPRCISLNDVVIFQIVQKLSARPPSLEIKMKLLKQIASENGVTLKDLEAYEDSTKVLQVTNEIESCYLLCWETF